MDKLILIPGIVLAILHFLAAYDINAFNNDTTVKFEGVSSKASSKVLSRRKRFLVFPDGSSFQLVFCTQTHGYLRVGDIVWFGNTAALAWELPTDPAIFSIFRDHKHVYENRRHDSTKNILYLNEDGKVIGKVPYRRRPIVNPAFAKRSIKGDAPMENNETNTCHIKEMHKKEKSRNHLLGMDKKVLEFHRHTRKSLYVKIEKFLEGLGWSGRECVLRLLCETGKGGRRQGSFLEEILTATFTLPQGREFDSPAHKEYDIAHGRAGDCTQMYPGCSAVSAGNLIKRFG